MTFGPPKGVSPDEYAKLLRNSRSVEDLIMQTAVDSIAYQIDQEVDRQCLIFMMKHQLSFREIEAVYWPNHSALSPKITLRSTRNPNVVHTISFNSSIRRSIG